MKETLDKENPPSFQLSVEFLNKYLRTPVSSLWNQGKTGIADTCKGKNEVLGGQALSLRSKGVGGDRTTFFGQE